MLLQPILKPQSHKAASSTPLATLILTLLSIIFFTVHPLAMPTAHAVIPLTIADLGDSYASGPKIDPQANPACGRSAINYGHLVASDTKSKLIDHSCSGAVTSDFVTPELHEDHTLRNAPQLNGIPANTDVILISIGGNDADVINSVIACATQAVSGRPCDNIIAKSNSEIRAAAQKTTAIYQTVRKQHPNALIIGVDYGKPLQGRTCLAAPFGPQLVQWINTIFDSLAAMVKNATASVGGTFLDTRPLVAGHDVCSLTPWYNGILPPPPGQGDIGHPNAAYMRAVATGIDRIIAAAHLTHRG